MQQNNLDGSLVVRAIAVVSAFVLAFCFLYVGWDIADRIIKAQTSAQTAAPPESAGSEPTAGESTVEGTTAKGSAAGETTSASGTSEPSSSGTGSDFSSGWAAVITAFIVAVIPFAIWGGRVVSSSTGGNGQGGAGGNGPGGQAGGAGNQGQGNADDAAGDTATRQTSLTAREPAVVAASIAAILQVSALLGLDLSASPEIAALVGVSTALTGLFIRGNVKPTKA